MSGVIFSNLSHRRSFRRRCAILFSCRTTRASRNTVCCGGCIFQKPPFEQAKLVRVVSGVVLDVAVDIRLNSPTYGMHVSTELSAENKRQIFIPRGFAHGFVVLSEEVIFQYKCDHFYMPGYEGAILWNDPQLNIDWKLPVKDIILSEKDKKNPLL